MARGRMGEHAIANHGPNELFVLIEPDSFGRSDFGPSDWNRERLYKSVSILGDEATTPAQAFTNTGEGKRLLSPVDVRGSRPGISGIPPAAVNDLTITWVRRSRYLVPGLGNGPVPLAEETERYEVDILDGGGNVVRTIATTTPSAFYSEAAQLADGLVPGAPVSLRVYQLSAVRGRGNRLGVKRLLISCAAPHCAWRSAARPHRYALASQDRRP